MANRIWIGQAPLVTQESRATPANVEIGDIFTLTLNTKTLSFTATAATVANVTAGLTAAWNALTSAGGYPEFEEITASDQTTYVKLLCDTSGLPFTVTGSATNGGAAATETLTMSTPTAATGPNHWDNAKNWSGNAVPIAADDVYIDNSAVSILYGLAQSAVTLTSLTITNRYTGYIGLPTRNAGGYEEYRATYMAISATTLTVGEGAGNGSGRIKIDVGSIQTALNIAATGSQVEQSVPALLFKGTHASNTADIAGGTVGIACLPAETSTILTLRQTGGTVLCGSGTTLTTVSKSAGTMTLNSAVTTLTQEDGELYKLSGATTTLNVNGGTVYYDSTGTITTATVNNSGILSFDRSNKARTVTTLNLNDNGTVRDVLDVVTFTNSPAWKGVLKASPK